MAVVCFDTQVLIWGVKGEASSTQQDMIPRTQRFIASLSAQGTKVVIPTVVVAELLIHIPLDAHP